jgi:hypothetical protein
MQLSQNVEQKLYVRTVNHRQWDYTIMVGLLMVCNGYRANFRPQFQQSGAFELGLTKLKREEDEKNSPCFMVMRYSHICDGNTFVQKGIDGGGSVPVAALAWAAPAASPAAGLVSRPAPSHP